jgi:hypothetical protein
MLNPSEIYASYYEGYEAFQNADPTNPYPEGDENRGPWADGWMAAFDDSGRAGR